MPGEVIIPAGQSPARITLTALNDAVNENNETVILKIIGGTKGKDFETVTIEKQKPKDKR